MKYTKQSGALATLLLLVVFSSASAQADEGAPATTKLIEAAQQYKTSTSWLLTIQEDEVNKAAVKLEELRMLVNEGLVARAELENAERSLAGLRSQLEATKQRVTESDQRLAEIQAQQKLAESPAVRPAKPPAKLVAKAYSPGAIILRSTGSGSWSLGGLAGLRSFFSTTFRRSLPTSAVGQSTTHNQLGYDHRNAVDVALHPDSAEGKSLISYLQTQGIPFLAFRAAVPGVATGPHIHIGSPSHRL